MKESHYNKGGIEVIDFIRDQLTPEEFNGFCKGNILKYVPRSNHKGDPIADAQKVRDYADYWINANLRAKPTFEVPIEEVQEAALEKVGLKLAEKQQEIDELKTVIDRLKVEIDTRSNEARNHGSERHRKNNLIKKLDADLKKAEKDRFNSVKMAEALRESVDRLQKENAELEQKEVVIESLGSQVGALLNEVKQREAENESLESQVGALLTEVKQREAENEKLKKDLGLNLPSNIDPSGRIAPADDAPDIDARFLSTDDDDGLPRIRY